ncbi:MAG: carboxymuconolactone decarboxylase family protein [Planctomycetota bacterium]|jgi:alkylhydroperoxidase family enzyme|nr:carboxymuconolactone decarboxylase family protein [Planctomycetota bacterium]MED5401649.1 carboxymuconolactone decarboxylase family protein [Planctomycetota bacterium]MED5448096.1 carboxymuconolactone decarboxylase family protein [Planctomycetota bacterium]MEE3364186.1 carboxymuconolactone decarboxylase family protein [Planctomycetota bacterium]
MPATPRIAWVEDDQASGELAEIYEAWREQNPDRGDVPEILKCFSARPDFLAPVMQASYGLHFTDGHLDRRQKEAIATYVSALNQCEY